MIEQLTINPENHQSVSAIPKNLLIVDLETTGLDPNKDQVLEVAACLFSVEYREILQSVCFLIPCEGENPVEHINHIRADLTRVTAPWRSSMQLLIEMIASADAMLAHNCSFDSAWFGKGKLPTVHIPWLCTMQDFDFGCRGAAGLRDLAANHGVAIVKAHRALADCELVAGVLSAREDLDELMEHAVAPKITVVAKVTFERKEEAKDRNFKWNPTKKRWQKKMTFDQYSTLKFPFQTVVIDDD